MNKIVENESLELRKINVEIKKRLLNLKCKFSIDGKEVTVIKIGAESEVYLVCVILNPVNDIYENYGFAGSTQVLFGDGETKYCNFNGSFKEKDGEIILTNPVSITPR